MFFHWSKNVSNGTKCMMYTMKLQRVSNGTTLRYVSNKTLKCVQKNFNMYPMELQYFSNGTSINILHCFSIGTSINILQCFSNGISINILQCFSNETKMCFQWYNTTICIQWNFKVCAKKLQYVSNGTSIFVHWNFNMYPIELQCFSNGNTMCLQ